MRLLVCAALACAGAASAETWRGLTVAAEHRCSPYRAGDYSYPQSVEPTIYPTACFHTPLSGSDRGARLRKPLTLRKVQSSID